MSSHTKPLRPVVVDVRCRGAPSVTEMAHDHDHHPVAAYYTWSGTNVEGNGVVATIEGPLSTDGLLNGEDNQLTRARQCLQEGVAA